MKIVLAYSGGLDTSIIIPWLKERYKNSKIVCVYVNTGQSENEARMRSKAEQSGAEKLIIVDAQAQFAQDYLFPLIRSGALYENQYFLGTAIARPLQAAHQVRIAQLEQADALAHGCTGKGNDQIRFELVYKALAPTMQIIAPWRIWSIASREDALAYARAHHIPMGDISEKNIYSRDGNIWHMSHEGGSLEDIGQPLADDIYRVTTAPKDAPEKETEVEITFKNGAPIAIDNTSYEPLPLLARVNELGAKNGIGRVDMVESRIIDMKSRALYETPGGAILYHALREIEAVAMNGELRAIKRFLADRYAEIVYRGRWYSEQRDAIDSFMERACANLNGTVGLTLYKGNIITKKRVLKKGLYGISPFSSSEYDPAFADGFIRLHSLSSALEAKQRPINILSNNYKIREFQF